MNRTSSRWRGAMVAVMVCSQSVLFGADAPPKDPYQAPFEKMPAQELVRQLEDEKTCSRAFYELVQRAAREDPYWRRHFGPDEGYELFVRSFPASRGMRCPQANGAPPLYLVSFNSSARPNRLYAQSRWTEGALEAPRPHELFPPQPDYRQSPVDMANREFRTFTSDGKPANSATFASYSTEDLADMTGDGVLDFAHATNHGADAPDAAHIRVLTIETVEVKPRLLLTLLLNWNAEDWSYRIRDSDGDGIADFEIGPGTGKDIRPRATFRWDKKAKSFLGPKPGKDSHFRVLNGGENIFAELEKLAESGLRFPEETQAPAGAKIAAASDAGGNEESTWKPFPSHWPAGFWDLEPKAAALAFAEANRTEDHRGRFRIALEDRDEAAPPDAGTLIFKDGMQGCFGGGNSEVFLHFDRDDSYLVTGRSSAGRNTADGNDLTVSWRAIPYRDARHVAAVIWWLERVRTFPADEVGMGMSTTTHEYWLSLRDPTGKVLLQSAELTSFPIWQGAFTKELFLEAAAKIITSTLTRTAEQSGGVAAARRILEAWTPDETRVSHSLAAAAVIASAGEPDVAVRFRAIAGKIPRVDIPKARDEQELLEAYKLARDKLSEAEFSRSAESEKPDEAKIAKLTAQLRAVFDEGEQSRIRGGMNGAEILRTAIESALPPDGKK